MLPIAVALLLPSAEPVAVVELFTSEGCSSCPPADAVLRDLAHDPRVIALGFHVDYWDGLGWKDPLSSSMASARQHAYTARLGRGDYTPQMIVNGRVEFVGSDSFTAKSAVSKALASKPSVAVALSAVERDGVVDVTWSLDRAPKDARVLVAIVADDVVHRVPRGENAGRTLHHDRAVVTSLERALDGPSGTAQLKAAGTRAIVVVSDATGVLGAAQATLAPTVAPTPATPAAP